MFRLSISSFIKNLLPVFCPLLVCGQSVTFSELNYNSDSTYNAGNWVELYNYGTTAVNIGGWFLKDSNNGNLFVFPANTTIQPAARLVVVNDITKFTSIYPSVTNYTGPFPFNFSNSADQVRLFDAALNSMAFMEYSDSLPWPEGADGTGRTLEIVNVNADENNPANWFTGCMGGSPGAAFSPCIDPVVFSEINYNSDSLADAGDWVELFNTTAATQDLSGWSFKDSKDSNIYFFANGTMLPAGGRLVLVHDIALFNSRHPSVTNYLGPFYFNLSNDGELIRLFDSGGRIKFSVQYDDDGVWPAQADGDTKTLELIFPNSNMNSAASWFAGCPEGSPGMEYDPDCPVSDEMISAVQRIEVMPTITASEFYIQAPLSVSPLSAMLFHSSGKLLWQETVKAERTVVSVKNFSPGIYFLVVTDNSEIHSFKIAVPQ